MDRPTEQPQNGSSLLKDKSTSPGLTVALWNRLKRLWRRYVLHRDRSRILELMFRAHVRRTMVFRVQTLLVAFAFLVLAMWPSDYWLFENPKVLSVFTFWRLTTVLTVVGIYVGISWLDPVRSRTIWTLILVLVGYSALTGYLFGEVRGLSFPWFYMAYMLPVFTVAVSLDFFQRLMEIGRAHV